MVLCFSSLQQFILSGFDQITISEQCLPSKSYLLLIMTMTKATIHFKGQVAELMESKGKLHAKVVCDTDNLLIQIEGMEGK